MAWTTIVKTRNEMNQLFDYLALFVDLFWFK